MAISGFLRGGVGFGNRVAAGDDDGEGDGDGLVKEIGFDYGVCRR